jgi:hypothetical protein
VLVILQRESLQHVRRDLLEEVFEWLAAKSSLQVELSRDVSYLNLHVSLWMSDVQIFLVLAQPDLRDAFVVSEKFTR